jgi:CheY-like chemotaxis protein
MVPDPAFLQEHPELAPGSYQRLTIRDSGCGIPVEAIPRIFDPFFTTKEPGEGTGMGLAVVMGIIQGHKGAVTVESTVGQGTAFHLLFPIVQAGDAQAPLELIQDLPSGRERILLVDDEEPLVRLGKLMLEQLGYAVTTQVVSAEALEMFRRDPRQFDLVITDMTMPGLTGDLLAKGLLAIRPDLPIILCTGYSSRISKERAKAIGIRHFVLKPLVVGELARTVRNVLDGQAA